AILVREPGATPLGDYVRDWIKRDSRTVPLAELFLFEAARAQLIQTVVKPALAEGRVVISDRFADSTLAYQGYGRGVKLSDIQSANRIAADGVRPDLTVLLDMDPGTALERVGNRPGLGTESTMGRVDDDQQRRFEQESIAFHERVIKGFRELAAAEPERWTVVDATQSAEEVAEAVWTAVEARLGRRA
ncbi:MAG: dTMP kinase, partial [Chloroflexota bacterium]